MKPRTSRMAKAGFTLAELIVATTLLTLVMTAVYTAFGSTLRAWRRGETNLEAYQDGRTAMTILARELGCILGGSEHLFEGKPHELEFFTVAPPMDLKKGEDARVLWVRYRYNPTGHTLVRQEAIVEKPLPLQPADGSELDKTRVKLGRKHSFDLASKNVRGFDLTYYWVPPLERTKDEPPEWVVPIEMDQNRQGWGLPQGLRATLTVTDPNSESGKTTFTFRTAFRGPTTPYDEQRLGSAGGL